MADGSLRPIELIRPGDEVISYDVATSVWEPKLVLDQWSHPDRGPPATATLDDGSTITATADHRFYLPALDEWVQLQHVRVGDRFLTPHGEVTVANLTVGPAHPWTVWELDVAGNDTFTVFSDSQHVLVHNNDDGPDPHSWTDTDDPAEYRDNWKQLTDAERAAARAAVPSMNPGEDMGDYINRLSPDEVRTIFADSPANQMKKDILAELRRPGGKHELIPVSELVRAKRLGLTVADIKALVLPTTLTGTDPGPPPRPFTHHGEGSAGGSKKYHDALRQALHEATSPADLLQRIKGVNADFGINIGGADPDYPKNWPPSGTPGCF